jgi:hypothetical protein
MAAGRHAGAWLKKSSPIPENSTSQKLSKFGSSFGSPFQLPAKGTYFNVNLRQVLLKMDLPTDEFSRVKSFTKAD